MSNPARPAAFFDRDGVLNVDHGYLFQPEAWEWMPGAVDAIRRLNALGYWVFVVTNQSGIARGYYAESDLLALHAWVQTQLSEARAQIDAFYFCPHGPDSDCECRKPKPGMILSAMSEFAVDASKSFLLGDKPSDVEAAEAAGIRGVLYTGGNVDARVQAVLRDEPDASEVF